MLQINSSLNLNKLRERLLPDVSGAAYACQCSWQSLAGLKELSRWGTPPGGTRLSPT